MVVYPQAVIQAVNYVGVQHSRSPLLISPPQGNRDVGVVISASGSHVTKAVTVTELLKRRVPVRGQFTNGGQLVLF